MSHVERFRALMNFQPVDRLPKWEWAPWWNLTIDRWHAEGLPAHLTLNDVSEISRSFGLDPYKQFWFFTAAFTIEAAPDQDGGPVSIMEDYLRIRPRLFPESATAIEAIHPWNAAAIEGLAPWAQRQDAGEVVLWFTLDGFFWFPRILMGFMKLMPAFLEQPELIHQINRDLMAFNLRLLEEIGRVCRPAFMTIAEDMSYNRGPMISPAMCEEFLTPYYRPVVERAKDLGILTFIDSDGDVTMLVPWMQSVGIDGVLPLERQAGVDGLALRSRFPTLRMIGHFDKMVMNRGEEAIRGEFERLRPLMRSGGFIPSVDHQTPPGVSLAEYRMYLKLLDEYL